jgi:hypothetical protein
MVIWTVQGAHLGPALGDHAANNGCDTLPARAAHHLRLDHVHRGGRGGRCHARARAEAGGGRRRELVAGAGTEALGVGLLERLVERKLDGAEGQVPRNEPGITLYGPDTEASDCGAKVPAYAIGLISRDNQCH